MESGLGVPQAETPPKPSALSKRVLAPRLAITSAQPPRTFSALSLSPPCSAYPIGPSVPPIAWRCEQPRPANRREALGGGARPQVGPDSGGGSSSQRLGAQTGCRRFLRFPDRRVSPVGLKGVEVPGSLGPCPVSWPALRWAIHPVSDASSCLLRSSHPWASSVVFMSLLDENGGLLFPAGTRRDVERKWRPRLVTLTHVRAARSLTPGSLPAACPGPNLTARGSDIDSGGRGCRFYWGVYKAGGGGGVGLQAWLLIAHARLLGLTQCCNSESSGACSLLPLSPLLSVCSRVSYPDPPGLPLQADTSPSREAAYLHLNPGGHKHQLNSLHTL
ncbi:Hypothetical predicted protein [Pelobates cultripes]|uniref:Uncharacterized protein n=1 Tax=Pelobates cultripes TaxID=61616 RepID=A0AAD1TJT3_PELCU|nr:Hypothetical predicted protein [Pelobates cultripes]